MSIRPMTDDEIRNSLRRAAAVCMEMRRHDWCSIDVCVADATFHAANGMLGNDDGYERDPDHAAFFLLLAAEAAHAE